MDIEFDQSIPLLDQVKIQAQVLVPVLRAFRERLGEERANEIALDALRTWSRALFLEIGQRTQGTPRERWEAAVAASVPRLVGALDVHMRKQEPDALEFDVTGCRYADFFRALGEPELGAVLLCESDDHMAAIAESDVALTRTQTIMKGGAYCDFRYRMRTGG
jgi:hypothetical protein